MSEIFNLNNGFFSFMGKAVDVVWVSILWVIACVPIITAGAATTALYYTVHKTIHKDESYVFREFIKAFKKNLKQSTICFMILLVLGGFLGMDAYVTYLLQQNGDAVGNIFYFIIALIVGLIVEAIYIFPYISRFQDNNKTVIKNAFFLALSNPCRTIMILISTVIAGYLLYITPYFIVIVPTIYMLAIEQMMEKNFKKFMPDEEEEQRKVVDGRHMGLFAGKRLKSQKDN